MGTTGILRPDEVVFYHPLDNFTEHTQSQTWTGSGGFTTGKIGSANSAVSAGAPGFGPANSFDTDGTMRAGSMAKLDSSKALICYNKSGTCTLRVATVSGTDVTVGPTATFAMNTSDRATVAHLGAGNVVVSYLDSSTKVCARAATVSGTDVTVGAVTEISAPNAASDSHKVGAVDSATALVVWSWYVGAYPDRRSRMAVVAMSGLTLTAGAVTELMEDADRGVPFNCVESLGSGGRMIVAWAEYTGGKARATVATVSGLDVTKGPIQEIVSSNVSTHSGKTTDMAVLSSDKFVFVHRSPNGNPNRGPYAAVCSVSGNDITAGASTHCGMSGGEPFIGVDKLDSSHAILHRNYTGVRQITVSGLDKTFSGTTATNLSYSQVSYTDVVALSAGTFLVIGRDSSSSGMELNVGAYALNAAMTAPTPGAYPSTIGATRVTAAMWATQLTGGSSTVTVERGYKIDMTATSISLGGTTAVWSDAGISTLMSTMNDGSDHLLVLDFENTGGTSWNLRTSVDGAAFADQGAQDSGTQAVTTTDTAPKLEIDSGAGDQWVDELVMWAGDKDTFDILTTEELANLNDLADTFGEPMDQYSENYDAPICWQATATLPNGTVWRDAGCGPCPPVIRVPRGAADVVVTDDGKVARPRIIEG